MRKIDSTDPINRSWSPNYSVDDVLFLDDHTPFPDVYPDLILDEVIFEDTRQQEGKHELKHEGFARHALPVISHKLRFGDYASTSHYVVDTKRNIGELAKCLVSEWWRFKDEAAAASNAGYALIVLTETDGVTTTDELTNWKNPTCYELCPWFKAYMCEPSDKSAKCHCFDHNKRPVDGQRLIEAIHYAESQFNIYFFYCKPEQAAGYIYDFLITRY